MATRKTTARGGRLRSRDVQSSLAPSSPAAQRPKEESGIHVEAIAKGFYGSIRRKVGDRFPLEKPEHFSNKWMKRVEGEDVKPSRPSSRGDSSGSGSGSSTGGAGVL